jgi:hypothetical protein
VGGAPSLPPASGVGAPESTLASTLHEKQPPLEPPPELDPLELVPPELVVPPSAPPLSLKLDASIPLPELLAPAPEAPPLLLPPNPLLVPSPPLLDAGNALASFPPVSSLQ